MRAVRSYYRAHGRHDLPWRGTRDPYRIAVSEIMLQQTQVPRVIEKYAQFLTLFPNVRSLAKAPLSKVLSAWSGLGYNRRAKFLHQMAKEIAGKKKAAFPNTVEELEALPGIGPYTARAIAAFAYDQPVVLIETNVRTAYLHHFFPRAKNVSDKTLLPIIASTLDAKRPREWYAALMDYGSHLKATGSKAHRKSAQYKKQGAFIGSKRQTRGAIVRSLIEGGTTTTRLAKQLSFPPERILSALDDLVREGIVIKRRSIYSLAP